MSTIKIKQKLYDDRATSTVLACSSISTTLCVVETPAYITPFL